MTNSLRAAVAALALFAGHGAAAEKDVDLKVGDKAPAFESVDDQGKAWKSADHVGKKILVVYFYPADLTGGCTKQACAFRDAMGKLTD
jgi:peroxiredoxin Q/BCP